MSKSKKLKRRIILIAVLAAIVFLYYYIELPAINIHSGGFWGFMILIAILLVAVLRVLPLIKRSQEDGISPDFRGDKPLRVGIIIVGALILIFIIGSILSSPIVNAGKYQKLLTVQEGDFAYGNFII